MEVNCCKPYCIESGLDFVDEVPGGEQDIIVIYNIICISLLKKGELHRVDKISAFYVTSRML